MSRWFMVWMAFYIVDAIKDNPICWLWLLFAALTKDTMSDIGKLLIHAYDVISEKETEA